MTSPAPATTGNIGRSIFAVFASFVVVVVLSLAIDQVLHVLNVYPPWGQPMFDNGLNALALSYRLVIGVGGGWVAGRLAPWKPVKHAIIVGSIGAALSALGGVGAVMMKMGPAWYPLLLAVSSVPTAWYGGTLVRPKA